MLKHLLVYEEAQNHSFKIDEYIKESGLVIQSPSLDCIIEDPKYTNEQLILFGYDLIIRIVERYEYQCRELKFIKIKIKQKVKMLIYKTIEVPSPENKYSKRILKLNYRLLLTPKRDVLGKDQIPYVIEKKKLPEVETYITSKNPIIRKEACKLIKP